MRNFLSKIFKPILLFIMLFCIFLTFSYCSDTKIPIDKNYIALDTIKISKRNSDGNVVILKAQGKLKIHYPLFFNKDYKVYFHIPIKFDNQIPVYYHVESKFLKSFKFIEWRGPNILISAEMKERNLSNFFDVVDTIFWTSYLITFKNENNDTRIIEERNQFSDDINGWLKNTDCVQFENKELQEISKILSNKSNSLSEYIKQINNLIIEKNPKNNSKLYFDAFSTNKWGSTCTGMANITTALLRSYNVPARSIMCIPTDLDVYMDMHWYLEYFIANKGWIKFEATRLIDEFEDSKYVKMYLTYPEDEFPKFTSCGIPSFWFTSDNELGDNNRVGL